MLLFPIVVILTAVTLGTALAFTPRGARHMGPVRTFALMAALSVVVLHLLPEAMEVLGGWALAAMFVGVAAPSSVERIGRFWWRHKEASGEQTRGIVALEVGYAGLLVHRMGDGLSIGAYSGALRGGVHVDVVLAVAAHIVPVTTVFVLAFLAARGKVHAILRGAGLAASGTLGVCASALLPTDSTVANIEYWVAAFVAGVLVDVVLEDLHADPPTDTLGRGLDFAAAVAGIAVSVVGALAHDDIAASGRLLDTLVNLTLQTAPMLLLGLSIAAALQAFGPGLPDLRGTRRFAPMRLTGRGKTLEQAIRGAVLGAPLPSCSCAVLPVSRALYARGATPALVVAFLLATPELGIETLTLTARFLGWRYAALRIAAALVAAIITALVVAQFTRSESHDDAVHSDATPATKTDGGSLARFLRALEELLFHVGAWTAVGLVAAAFIGALLPPASFERLRSNGLDVLVMSVISIPSYVCASSATPLGAVLLAKGFSPGAVLVGLLLGPTMNFTTLAFLGRGYGWRAAAAGIVTLVSVSWGLAALVNAFLPDLSIVAEQQVSTHDHGPIALISAAVLVALLLRGVWRAGTRHWLSAMLPTDAAAKRDHGPPLHGAPAHLHAH